MKASLRDVLIRFKDKEPPENIDLLVCSGMGQDKIYSILRFCKAGHIMLHEYTDRYKGDKCETHEARMMYWLFEGPNDDTITEDELNRLLKNFDLQEDRDYVVATQDSYFVYELTKDGRCKYRQLSIPEPYGSRYVVLN